MFKKHWNVRYLMDRAMVQIYRKRYGINCPAISVQAIDFLVDYLKKKDKFLEYGSGNSTKFYSLLVGEMISVENNKKWYEIVKKQTAELENVELYLCENKPGESVPGSNVTKEYCGIIDKYPDSYFDVIMNDGYARHIVACKAVDKVKRGGVIIWDDAVYTLPPPRKTYIPESLATHAQPSDAYVNSFLEVTKDWRKVYWDDGVHSTAFFFKP